MLSKENISIKEWQPLDRPREKLIASGPRSLTDTELTAILIGSGSTKESAVELSRRILMHYKGDLNELSQATVKDLESFEGIGTAKAVTILAALELGKRRYFQEVNEPRRILSSKQVAEYMRPLLGDLPHEEFWIVLLNRASRIIDRYQVSKGGVSSTTADTRIIFKEAFQKLAASFIAVHNHPSGNLQPSIADIELTARLRNIGELIGMPVRDHLIITQNDYYSFADDNKL